MPYDNAMTLMITKAEKSDKKEILRFYKQQHYSARFLGFDQAYFIKKNEAIIACVIVSNLSSNCHQALLHALVVDKAWRKQRIASKLLEHCTTLHEHIVCFADSSLSTFYKTNGFYQANIETIDKLLEVRYLSYQLKDSNLVIFKY